MGSRGEIEPWPEVSHIRDSSATGSVQCVETKDVSVFSPLLYFGYVDGMGPDNSPYLGKAALVEQYPCVIGVTTHLICIYYNLLSAKVLSLRPIFSGKVG